MHTTFLGVINKTMIEKLKQKPNVLDAQIESGNEFPEAVLRMFSNEHSREYTARIAYNPDASNEDQLIDLLYFMAIEAAEENPPN